MSSMVASIVWVSNVFQYILMFGVVYALVRRVVTSTVVGEVRLFEVHCTVDGDVFHSCGEGVQLALGAGGARCGWDDVRR